jgi:ABC-type phosphate/phosphonate transport system substrate-binding protein
MLFAVSFHQALAETITSRNIIFMGGSTNGLRNTNQQDAEITFNTLLDDALKNSELKLNIVVFPTTDELYAAFDRGEIDGLFGSAVEYFPREDQLSEETMALGFKGNGVKQRFIIVVRKEVGVTQVKDLKNKRITLSKGQDTEAVFLNTLLLRQKLPEIPGFFAEVRDTKNPSIALMDVFFSKSDVTIVRENEFATAVELNPQLGKKLAIIEKSEPYVPAMGSVRRNLTKGKVTELIVALKKIYGTETGKKVLSYSQAVSLETITREDKQSVRDLLNEYRSLKNATTPIAEARPITKSRVRKNAQ